MNDPNSLAFGESSGLFSDSVLEWAWASEEVNHMELWRQLVNNGYDKTAAENYVKKGSSAANTPRSEQARQARIDSLQKFIKGELSKLIINWILAIRLELKIAKSVVYEDKPADWKKKLDKEVAQIQRERG